jgi:fructose-bisphosphate aldolase, class I
VNAQALARYAALCQEAGIVPIVEPEVLMDTDHSIDACHDATARTLQTLFAELVVQRVDLEGILLKPNMVIPGKGNADQASPKRIAQATLDCFRRHVPAVVPGIVFLSGGQSEVEATANLDAINRLDGRVWPLSFSYGRALQASTLVAWHGLGENTEAAQAVFLHRARCNAAAAGGRYDAQLEALGPA